MKKHILYLFYIPSIFLLLSACFPLTTTTAPNDKSNVSSAIYNPFIYRIHPEYFVYHTNGQNSRLYTKIYLDELMFAPIGPNRSSQGKVKIEYSIYSFENPSNFVDSASAIYEIKKRKEQNNAITYLNIKETGLSKYYLHIITTDELRQASVEDYILVNKEGLGARQNFLIEQKNTNLPYFKNYFRKDQVFSIHHKKTTDSIFIRYCGKQAPLPFPPYSSMQRQSIVLETDSVWTVNGQNDFQFREQKNGFYFIQLDTNSIDGVGMLNVGMDFPYLRTAESLVYPLEYLTSTLEFNELLKSSNKKLSVDKFWLGAAKEMNRSRELIRIYYNRAFYANTYFTSFTEGWRTDRGMIYLMFGPPKSVTKTPEKETWIYSDKMNSKYLQFVFNRMPNQYTDNDFLLERNIDFRQFWSKAVDSWREGKVYNVFN